MSNPKAVLGISGLFHDSAAALVQGPVILAAAQEERFTRKKGDWSFPSRSIDYCLAQLPDNDSLDALAFYENPTLKMDRIIRNAMAMAPGGAPLWPQTLRTLLELNENLPRSLRSILDDPERIFFMSHHRSHAASAFYPSPFDRAAVLVVDGVGEWSTTSIWSGTADGLTPVHELRFPHSLGLLYSAFTQYCGFSVNSGEYKLMGLAPFGQPIHRELILDKMIEVKPDGSFALDMKFFEFHTGTSTISPLFGYLLGQPARLPSDPITQHFMDVAASAQAVIEEVMIALVRTALKSTDMRNLCLAGGVGLNCVANGRLLGEVTDLDGIWIQPAAGDAGGALGAALEVSRLRSGPQTERWAKVNDTPDAMQDAFLGPGYENSEIEAALRASGIQYDTYDDDTEFCQIVGAALVAGQIVGHFDGRMEFGPRALGNRSILADPRPNGTLTRVNMRIKFRESWRPFAPVILAEELGNFFEGSTENPYMLLVAHLREQSRIGPSLDEARRLGLRSLAELQEAVTSEFNAVSHVDYSSRVQTLNQTSSSRAYRILRTFFDKTNCPMLLNTSFNVRGEPVVNTPKDAIDCFLNTHIDVLAIGPYIANKAAQTAEARNKVGRTKFRAD